MNKLSVFDSSLFDLGFRLFFLGAILYSIIAVTLWASIYVLHTPFPLEGITTLQWHAHEMIFGFVMAVITGFLLTAVMNWTGIETIKGTPLALLFLAWLLARVCFSFTWLNQAMLMDLLFSVFLLYCVASPIIRSRNWRQTVILSKLVLLLLANTGFYLGYLGVLQNGIYWGIYGGLYLVISLILTIGARVIPLFIERGVDYPVTLSSPKWVAVSGLLVFLVFFISDVFLINDTLAGICAAALFVIYSFRLYGWHTPGIWNRPLLWGLYLAIAYITLGFLLFALSVFSDIPKLAAIHAFAYGGIGLITTSMMCRVILGHTGRNVNAPCVFMNYVLGFLLVGSVVRVFLPLLAPGFYGLWILISQILWIVSFLLLLIKYAPMLFVPCVDGRPG